MLRLRRVLLLVWLLLTSGTAWPDKLPGEKQVFTYSFQRLTAVVREVLRREVQILPGTVHSSSQGDALFLTVGWQVIVVPLDPDKPVRVLPFDRRHTTEQVRLMEGQLLGGDVVDAERSNIPGGHAPASGRDSGQRSERSEPQPTSNGRARYQEVFSSREYYEGSARRVYVAEGRVYAFSCANKNPQTSLKCEVFIREGDFVTREDEFLIESPAGPHSGNMNIEDFDPEGLYLLLSDCFELPFFFRNKGLVFDLNKRTFIWEKYLFSGKAVFLRGDVLARFDHPKKDGRGESDKDGAKGE